jgi:hypothetical protein
VPTNAPSSAPAPVPGVGVFPDSIAEHLTRFGYRFTAANNPFYYNARRYERTAKNGAFLVIYHFAPVLPSRPNDTFEIECRFPIPGKGEWGFVRLEVFEADRLLKSLPALERRLAAAYKAMREVTEESR